MSYYRGTRVQLTKTIHIQDRSAWNYVILSEGPQCRLTPGKLIMGTCGVIDKKVDGDYSVLFSIPLGSHKFAEIYLLINEKDFKLPDGKVLGFDQSKRRKKDA